MSARSQVTLCAQLGGLGEEVTEDQMGSPDRLKGSGLISMLSFEELEMYLMDVTSQPLTTAYLHILEPRKPFPPHTTSLFVDAMMR